MKCLIKWLLALGLVAGLAAALYLLRQKEDVPDYITLYEPEEEEDT